MTDDFLEFADEQQAPGPSAAHQPWKLLIVDDEEAVHQVTKLALQDFEYADRTLEFIDAYSGSEAIAAMQAQPDIAVILMDAVMETDHAGLDAVTAIRKNIANKLVRIILRTGHAGDVPARMVITQYDINDYKDKTELTADKLFVVVHSALHAYQDLVALDRNRAGLERVIKATSSVLGKRTAPRFAHGVLEQLSALLYLGEDTLLVGGEGIAAVRHSNEEPIVIAGTGRYANLADRPATKALEPTVAERIAQALEHKCSQHDGEHFVHYIGSSAMSRELVFYIETPSAQSVAEQHIIELFCRNVAVAFDNLSLNEQLRSTQQELILMLSEAIELRAAGTGNHVRRVAEYSALLAELYGLANSDVDILRLAAPLHDVGKVAIPDAILNKPGRHTPAEQEIMRQHAELGADMFKNYELPVLKAAQIIALEHHEQWSGKGYPQGKAGEDIHVYGRIVSVADVYDALLSVRCYKQTWSRAATLDYLREESGERFEPRLVELLIEHQDKFERIAEKWPDQAAA